MFDAHQQINRLLNRITGYGKENLAEILHLLAEALPLIAPRYKSRIYLEDLTSGSLICMRAIGLSDAAMGEHAFPITSDTHMVPRIFRSQQHLSASYDSDEETELPAAVTRKYQIRSSHFLPIIHKGRSIGVLCLDTDRKGQALASTDISRLTDFLDRIAPHLDRARKYRQQLILARRVDAAKKKEAAYRMVKSAASLIDKLALASVLVPSDDESTEGLQILAAYSKETEARRLYAEDKLINLKPGSSLLARYINSSGIITDDTLLNPLAFPDLSSEELQKRYLTERLGLRSLYVVPRYEPKTRRVVCLVNYYTKEVYHFSEFERGLLEAHAEMVHRAIQEIGNEHIEIQVLAEINDLLVEKFSGPQPFLNRVLAKATELIGADTGSIALVRLIDGVRWLFVEEKDGTICGAKSKEWLKRNIPPIRVGGSDLPFDERSLTGLAADSGTPQIISDTKEERATDGFYREITELIRSEIAIPVISDEEVIAVICLDSFQPNYFTGEHLRILQIIARMISRQLSDLQRIETLTSEVNLLRTDVGYRDPKISSYRLGNIIGNARASVDTIAFIERICGPLVNRVALWHRGVSQETTLGLPSILITGETGSGKEFIFNNIYSRLNSIFRAQGFTGELPLKKSNIAAYSGDLTYSELFGHKRGAYTGAHADRKGILEEAHGGVVFLDEIGDADPKTQVQLLRFLDNGGFVRLGENQTRYSRVILIAATNKDLGQLIAEGKFRADLYHRLSELQVRVPSLNQRREDIPDLATHFLGLLWRVYQVPTGLQDPPTISREAQHLLTEHHFSGNMRELRSILLRALFFCRGRELTAADVRNSLPELGGIPGEQTEQLIRQQGELLFHRLMEQEGNFWDHVYMPFTNGEMTKETVRELVRLARREGGNTMPKIAALLGAVPADDKSDEGKRALYRFKNFLYKTVKIG